MTKKILTISYLLISLSTFSQEKVTAMEISGTMTGARGGKLFIYDIQGKSTFKADSCIVANGTFSFPKREYADGIYMIGMNENNMCPVILSAAEPKMQLQFNNMKLEQGLASNSSPQNQAWGQYILQEPVLLKAIKDAKVGAHKNPDQKATFDKQLAEKESELLALQKKIATENPKTHLAKIMNWKQEPNRTEIGKYWDNLDFNDESIIRSKVLTDRIESFMRTFSKGSFYNCIAVIAERAKVNDKVYEFALGQMLTGFYESGMEDICLYIIDNYISDESCGDSDLSNIIKSTASSIQSLAIGNTPPNIQLDEMKGGKVDLYEIATKNKYTLVMFWASYCEHCKGEAPEVKASYENWHKKGVEFIGVSIDRQKSMWETAANERGFIFPNVCGYKDFQSPVAKDYRVIKTPSFFLIDAKKKIVLKPKSIREMNQFLAKNIK